MDIYQIISYPLYAGGILEVIFGIALLKQAPRNDRAMLAGALLFFAAAGFVLCTAISYTLESQGRDFNFFNRSCWIGWFMIPACLQFIYYVQDENSRAARAVGWTLYPFWGIVFALTLFTDLVEPGDTSLIPFVAAAGPLENPIRIIGSIMAVWLLMEVYRAKQRMTGIKKAQLNLFFYGTLFFNLGCILIAGILPLFGAINPAFTTFFSLPWVVLTYYAITRHRLFDLRLMISRALTITLLSILLAAVHIGLFRLLHPSLGDTLAILVSLSIIGLIFFGTQLSSTVSQWIQRLVVQDKYDYQRVLRESTKAVITILDPEELMDYLMASVKKSLGTGKVCIALPKTDNGWSLRQGNSSNGTGVNSCPWNEGVADQLRQTGQAVVKDDFERTRADDKGVKIQEYMNRSEADLIIPLSYKDDLKGYLVLGKKGKNEPYIQSDLELLETLAGQAAVAMENARLYHEARQVKESFQESEKKFRTLAETAAMAIFIHQGGNFLYANRAAEIIGGYTVAEYMTMNFMSLVHPDYVELVKTRARERLAGSGEIPAQYEFKILRKNREERWVLMTAGVSAFEGKPAVIGTLIDITARKQAEEERERFYQQLQKATMSLAESEAKFRTLAETTTAGIFIHRGGKLIYANPAGEKIAGYSNVEFLAMDFWQIIHPEYRDLVRERGRARLIGMPLPPEYEFRILTKQGGERLVSMTAGVIEYEGQLAVIATLFDVTDRKLAEDEQVNLYEARIAEEKRHVLEKGKILMDLHDGIGGITTNISILSELGQKATDVAAIKNTLATISRLSREGISEIRSFMQGLDTQELSWRTLSAEFRNQGTNMLEPHSIAFNLASDVDNEHEQPGSLLWVNLFKIYKEALTNVIKHSQARSVNVVLRISPDLLLLIVEDTGTGWESHRGNGRGLSNMKRRAEEIGGTLAVSSGKGTRVSVEIPLPLKYPEQGMEL
jgi:PAS domain S-box-containing protein